MTLETKTSSSNKWEYLVPLLATVSLIIACAIASDKKPFWNDELLSFFLISDPSFTHLMGAWGDTFNQAPPLYFLLGWLWAKVFNTTDLSLRLFSSLSICVVFTLVWITLWRIQNNPKYKVKSLGFVDDGERGPLELFLVDRKKSTAQ